MTSPAIRLDGKRLLITGAARGLGAAFAEAALAAGARVAIADILEDRGRETAAAIGADFVAVDLADPDSVEACAGAAVAALGGLDGLLNNGAIATGIGGKTLEEIDIETWDRVMAVNVRGTWLMTKACLPALRAGGAGKVVNLASDTALWGAPNLLSYVASKGAVISMTRSLARELGPTASRSTPSRRAWSWWRRPNTCRRSASPTTSRAAPCRANRRRGTWSAPRCSCCPTPPIS